MTQIIAYMRIGLLAVEFLTQYIVNCKFIYIHYYLRLIRNRTLCLRNDSKTSFNQNAIKIKTFASYLPLSDTPLHISILIVLFYMYFMVTS